MGKGNVFFLKQPFKYHLNSYKMGNLISFMKNVANGLRESGNYGTAHIYRSSMRAVISFHGSENLPFRKVTQEFLKNFETYLRGRDCSWNTVSTYMRTLRAVYNLSLIHI